MKDLNDGKDNCQYKGEFTKEMRKTHTILAPDIFPMHMDLITEIFRMYGYKCEALHCRGKEVLDTGLKYIHNDMCYPAICSIGQQLYSITKGGYDPKKVALIQFQTGGGCRASNYVKLLKKALKNMDMEYVPVLSLNLFGMEKNSGFVIKKMMLYKGLISLAYGDTLMLLKNQVKPYEIHKGQCEKLVAHWNKKLIAQFERNRGLTIASIRQNMRNIVHDFSVIEKNDEKKVKVGIVGEIYVKYSPFGNNCLEELLAEQDCEYMVPGVLGFCQYCLANAHIDNKLYGGGKLAMTLSDFAQWAVGFLEKAMLDALKEYPQFVAPKPFKEVEKSANIALNEGVKMGEGWLLPAEMLELIDQGYANIVCTQPFGCLPNHIVGKGVIRKFKELRPNSNICPIDYDASATRVNQENRIKLMLAVAKERI